MAKSTYNERMGVQIDPEAFKTNIRALRKHMGHNDVEFGKELGVSPGAVRMWESGKAVPSDERIDHLVKIAKDNNIDIDPEFLFAGKGEEPGWVSENNFRRHRPRAPFMPAQHGDIAVVDTIPVKAAIDNGDGSITINGEIERVQAPRNLAGRAGAYGVYVPNDDMAPALRYGDIAWVDTLMPPGRDMEVLIEGPDGTAAIGTLVSMTKDEIVIETLRPKPKQTTIARSEARIHRIVGKEARR
jgi:transcriptional regulator with XRE-family HTH domain